MIIFGKQVVFYYLQQGGVKRLFLAKELDKKEFAKLASYGVKIEKLDFKKAQALAHGGNHQGFLAEVDEFKFCEFAELKKCEKIAILHELSDIGNLGAIARSAYALGLDGLIYSGKNIKIDAAIRASAGALSKLKMAKTSDILSVINELKQVGFKIYAANNSENAKAHNETQFAQKTCLVLGSEGAGLSAKIIKSCTDEIKIKMHNNFDSLNVASAFAILADRMINA